MNANAALDAAKIEDLRGRLQHAVDKGPLPSIQVAVALHGQLVLFETFGAGDNETRYNVFSCTKPLVAAAIWTLMGEGRLDITLPVCHYIPPFAENDKQDITVEQVMCHTSGFPRVPMDAPEWWTREGRRDQMRDWRLNWVPGSRMEYHALSAHWVLAELIETITGSDYRDYIRTRILDVLGLHDLRLGVPEEEQSDIATLILVGEPPTSEELSRFFGTEINIRWPDATDDSLLMFNEPQVRALGVPGGGAISTAADMAMFYQGLISNPGDIWRPEILADAIGHVRVDFVDPITGAPANRGLGVVIAGSGKYLPHRGMGSKVSPRAFGHQGMGGQVAWGDPVTGLSFCMVSNGIDANPLRSGQLCAAASNRAGASVRVA